MKKLTLILVLGVWSLSMIHAQQTRYLVFEFIKVESSQTYDFIEFKDFMEKVYRAAISDKKIQGWDFWSLQSGADPSEFQYITIIYYRDPVSMMNGISEEEMIRYSMVAYPDLTEAQIKSKMMNALTSRDLAQRAYMMEIASTKDNFQLRKGTLASFDMMKAMEGQFQDYETAEKEVFLPIHQKRIEKGLMGSWAFLRTALPSGSEAKFTHMTMNIFKDYMQFFSNQQFEDFAASVEEQTAVEKGLKSRDQKHIYLSTLETALR